ncbi:hypothetical protein GCM10009665_46990 [Kitasatospora nipponensis]|uniref:Secreted protein n=1 Tax=Kitasatospora nipponensis TaxID=258049 RepID=A0ABP4H7E2_9ACTN
MRGATAVTAPVTRSGAASICPAARSCQASEIRLRQSTTSATVVASSGRAQGRRRIRSFTERTVRDAPSGPRAGPGGQGCTVARTRSRSVSRVSSCEGSLT